VFLDEAGSHVSMTREHAWAPVGERVWGHVPRNRGKVLKMLAAITLAGIEAAVTYEGGTCGSVFLKDAVNDALAAVTPQDAEGWFLHCGYAAPCN